MQSLAFDRYNVGIVKVRTEMSSKIARKTTPIKHVKLHHKSSSFILHYWSCKQKHKIVMLHHVITD